MSFDLFVGCFRDGDKASFPRTLVESHFGAYVTRKEPTCLTLRFGADGESYLYIDDSLAVDGFSINRPVASAKLFEALFGVLKSGNLVLYMPGACPPLVADTAVIEHLPRDMIESLGTPVALSCAEEIPRRIRDA